MLDSIISAEVKDDGTGDYVVRFLASGEVCFHADEVWESGLYEEGKTIDIDGAVTSILEKRMRQYVLPYSTYCRRTEAQIVRRIKEQFCAKNGYSGIWERYIDAAADNVIAYLKEEGFAGDAAYAGAYFRSSRDKNVSSAMLVRELVSRGVDRDTAENAAREADRDDASACRAALEKKLRSKHAEPGTGGSLCEKDKAAIMRFLASRGFETGLIFRTIEEYDFGTIEETEYEDGF